MKQFAMALVLGLGLAFTAGCAHHKAADCNCNECGQPGHECSAECKEHCPMVKPAAAATPAPVVEAAPTPAPTPEAVPAKKPAKAAKKKK